jgi:lysophospholipase L1-like esterase
MGGMPSTTQLRRRAPRALAPVAAMLLLAGCGLDGSDPGVKALVPATTVAANAGGADAEIPPEQSADASGAQVPSELPDGAPAHLPQASLPPIDASDVDLPDSAAVVGDSLTESAKQEIGAYLEGLGVDTIMIDGAKNRRMADGNHPDPGVDIVERIARVTEPEVWVIALGTNDVGAEVSPDQYAADIETLLAEVPEGAPVVWVDVWIRDRKDQVVAANHVLRDTLATRPDTIVADWFSHGEDPGIIADDGIHLTSDGRFVFAATIAASVADLFDN